MMIFFCYIKNKFLYTFEFKYYVYIINEKNIFLLIYFLAKRGIDFANSVQTV